jgi:hypothetical protein
MEAVDDLCAFLAVLFLFVLVLHTILEFQIAYENYKHECRNKKLLDLARKMTDPANDTFDDDDGFDSFGVLDGGEDIDGPFLDGSDVVPGLCDEIRNLSGSL